MNRTAIIRTALILPLAASLCDCSSRGKGRDERPTVARVAGVPIYVDEFKREYRRIRLDDENGLPAAGGEQTQKRALLDNLIERRLILQDAERANVIVGTDEVESAFNRVHAGWEEGDFKEQLTSKDLTPSELKNELRESLIIRKYFREHVYSRIAVTDQEIEAYLAANPESLVTPEQVRARYVVVKTEEEGQRVLSEIKGGLSIEDAAMKYSQSPDGRTGGDLGWFSRGVMPRVFDEVCFTLPVGEISKVVPGEYGFYVFKVLEKKPAQARSPEAVRDQVEATLRREKERAAQVAKTAELRKAAAIEIQEEQLAAVY